MRNKIVAFVIICCMMMSFSLSVFSDNEISNGENANNTNTEENKTLEEKQSEVNSQIEESNNKLQYVQGELSENLQKVESLEDSITQYQSQFDDLQTKISTLENQISDTNKKLEEEQDLYNRKEKILKKRVVALYESGDTTYLDMLVSSKNIVEFISNYFIIGELVEYDSELLDEISEAESRIEQTKQKQESQQNELKSQKSKVLEMNILLQNTQTVKENYMLKLSDEEKSLQEQILVYKLEQTAIQNQILMAVNSNISASIQYTGGVMIWPVAMSGTYITSGFGMRLHPIQGVYKNHDGLDISGSNIYGMPVVAAADGIVSFAGVMSGYGNCVIINHGSGISTLYGHGSEIVTQLGNTVKQGDIIMKVGSTGNSTGPHLHFEVIKDGLAVDPTPYLNGIITNINQSSNTINNVMENGM